MEGVTALDRSRGLWASRNSWGKGKSTFEKWIEGHADLGWAGKHTDTRRQHLPDASAVLCLQGKLWQAHSDTTKAIDCYVEALKLNPFMWDAFLGLCDLGTL